MLLVLSFLLFWLLRWLAKCLVDQVAHLEPSTDVYAVLTVRSGLLLCRNLQLKPYR
jgi:hypothetical protein